MALSISSIPNSFLKPLNKILPVFPSSISIPTTLKPFPSTHHYQPIITCLAAKQQQTSSVKPNKKKKKKSAPVGKDLSLEGLDIVNDDEDGWEMEIGSGQGKGKGKGKSKRAEAYVPLPLPKPPAGFVVDDQGRVLMASSKTLITIVDPTNNLPLDCIIRRVFTSSNGDDCLLLCPVDTPVQIMKSTNIEGWSAVSDDEVESLLPTVAYALAKIHMHLVHSGFCYTARGAFCYSEESIFDLQSDDGEDIDGVPNEGLEITCFHMDGAHYMLYTPSDPLLFVAVKDEDGQLRIADDDLLDDPAVVSAIDEETEFNALVEEEAALLESVFGEDALV